MNQGTGTTSVDDSPAPTATLSEADSKDLLSSYGMPVLDERRAPDTAAAVVAATEIGLPCVVKLCGDAIAHKTERNLVRLSLHTESDVERAASELLDQATDQDGPVELLVAPMVAASREFIVGAQRTDDFGPVLMVGVGGIFAEVIEDVSFRLLPVDRATCGAMLDDLTMQEMLGPFRGEPAVDRDALLDVMAAVGSAMVAREDIMSIDINPVLIADGKAIAVDALVELA